MAAAAPPSSAPVLSQKRRRAALRKERRKRKRQALAQAQESDLKDGAPAEEEEDLIKNGGDEEEEDDDDDAEKERLRLHEEWLERERLAQEEFRLCSEREEAARRRKEEEERMIKEEWEAQQRREEEEAEQRQQERRGREEAVQKMLDEAENQLENGGAWMNPEAPVKVNSENYGTERDVANCPFFLKTGACRFGDRCSRKHHHPSSSPTLLLRSMFKTFGMEESRRDDYDIDAWLEHSEEDLQEAFLEFYHDVLPEFKSVGKVVQFKVSCNYEPHLRGNVYVQFDTEERCKEAFVKFNGRWYAGRQLHCEICPVTRWKNAICGLFDRQKCTKGKHCNFLHVFRNPGNEFWEADRDLHLSPDRSVRGGRRDGWHSERYGDRSWRRRRYSRSPERSERSERSRSRRDDDRRRSREGRASRQHGEDRRTSRSQHADRRTALSRDRSKDRDSRDRDAPRERSRSPKKTEKSQKAWSEDAETHRRHKHAKKSKKKSKKKHKKKSPPPRGTPSSREEEESEEEGEESADQPRERSEAELTETLRDSETPQIHSQRSDDGAGS